MNSNQMIVVIEAYYKSINRNPTPKFYEYTNLELKQTIILFDIKIENE
jgi:hypothetical protein